MKQGGQVSPTSKRIFFSPSFSTFVGAGSVLLSLVSLSVLGLSLRYVLSLLEELKSQLYELSFWCGVCVLDSGLRTHQA